jgi:hypothetical protein
MNLPPSFLGQYAVTRLQETARSAVLEIGSDKITRKQLAQVECYNFHAARLLTGVMKALEVPNLRHVYNEIPPAALAVPGMGVVSLAVLGAAFEAAGIGGDTPLESYVRKHAGKNGKNGKSVTFETLKHREQEETTRERRDRKRRKQQRRDQAHALRVDRFQKQQQP